MKLNDLRISTQLRLGFGLLALLIVLISSIALLKIDTIDKDFDVALEDEFPVVVGLYEIEGFDDKVGVAVRNMLLVDDPAARKKEAEDIAAARKQISAIIDKLKEGMVSTDEKAVLAKVIDARAGYVSRLDKLLEQVAAGKTDEAKALLLGDMSGAQVVYLKTLDEAIAFQNGELKKSQAEADQAVVVAKTTLWAGGGIALVLAVMLALAIVRSITAPLAEAVALARAVADGDLSSAVHAQGRNETARLLLALRDMQASLAKVVANVRQNADSVATASAQIAQGNQDLSQRTEEQASALEETAASMEQLGSTVKQNADNARQANQLAMSASTVAVEGGQVVGQVVETMKGINDSSRRIADIISVIDGIAFQTNILALNAAVEAARAGEQGRGFAVVASEVRSLAQRSAEAAKEIKSLIGASVERVEQGSALVDKAGGTMNEVVTAIRRVTDIMGEISSASTEQSAGVAQVGEAVSQMDKTTQQNAALVEESAAAAESLKDQAQQLVKVVAVFKLGAGSDGPARVAAAPGRTAPETVPAPAQFTERRSPGRATNVVRPEFKAASPKADAQPGVARQPTAAAEKSGTDGWESF